jgi:hypothetical protein
MIGGAGGGPEAACGWPATFVVQTWHLRRVGHAYMPRELLVAPFTVGQGRDAGLTARQLQSDVWRRVLRGVYVNAALEDSLELRAAAVKLVLPDDAVVGITAGAFLHGADVRRRTDAPLEVIAQRGDQIRRVGIAASSALLEPGDVVEVFGVPVTSPTRTAFDLARRKDLIESVVGVDAMLNRGGCILEDLTTYVAEHRGWRGVRYADAALLQAEPLAQSPMETRQRMRLILAGLPRPKAQAPVKDGSGEPFAFVDNGYEEWQVGADYDGEPHKDRWRHDLERGERIRDWGWWHRRYTSLHVGREWQFMVDQVGRALWARGWRPA